VFLVISKVSCDVLKLIAATLAKFVTTPDESAAFNSA
jgi:hypothetical protein